MKEKKIDSNRTLLFQLLSFCFLLYNLLFSLFSYCYLKSNKFSKTHANQYQYISLYKYINIYIFTYVYLNIC